MNFFFFAPKNSSLRVTVYCNCILCLASIWSLIIWSKSAETKYSKNLENRTSVISLDAEEAACGEFTRCTEGRKY